MNLNRHFIHRAVSDADKALAQGFSLWMVSLLAFIPGPIIYGYIIDSTCLVWNKDACSADGRGNCQLYDQTAFRWWINMVAIAFTVVAIYLDYLVWLHCKDIDMYGDKKGAVVNADDNDELVNEKRRKSTVVTMIL